MAGDRDVQRRFETKPGLAALAVLLLVAVIVLVLYDRLYPYGLGPVQPIPFSHRVHVHVKHIGCFMCHTGAPVAARAGIPPLETCLLCHRRIITTFPYIVKLRRHFDERQPVLWQRVNWLPEFVYFNHSVHIQRGVDCGKCHGNVTMMDRVVKAEEFQMGFCIQCHRDENATHDCFGCHR